MEQSPIASANAGGIVRVFFCDAQGDFRDGVYDIQTSVWQMGNLRFSWGPPGPDLLALAWRGQVARMQTETEWVVFCPRQDGFTFEARSLGGEAWRFGASFSSSGKGSLWGYVWKDDAETDGKET